MIRNSYNFITTDKPISGARNIIFVKFVCLFIIFVFLVLTAHTQTVSAQTFESSLFSDLSKTLGFIMGQRYSLNLIKAEYPNLALQAQVAESEFEISFSNAEKNIKYAIQEILKEEYPEFLETLEKKNK
ncbi:MAG: hypothetical protein L6305_05985 [Actinomycetia bacterium]|nr:hypothetical protein [Actinomycetes bacterium]